jgi:hypothetical protein
MEACQIYFDSSRALLAVDNVGRVDASGSLAQCDMHAEQGCPHRRSAKAADHLVAPDPGHLRRSAGLVISGGHIRDQMQGRPSGAGASLAARPVRRRSRR